MAENYILECSGISKAFGGTQALKDVQLRVRPGEVHALLGENGAGKSTLMKIVIGLYHQDSGTMTFDGKPYQAKGPVDAINSGISMIHQELNPEPHLTIAESIFLKREDTSGIFLNKRKQNERTQKILDDFGFPYPATTLIRELKLADVQMVEIIRAVSTNAKMIRLFFAKRFVSFPTKTYRQTDRSVIPMYSTVFMVSGSFISEVMKNVSPDWNMVIATQ